LNPQLQERVAKLSDGGAVIKVGAAAKSHALLNGGRLA
jgi:hypothetical protein